MRQKCWTRTGFLATVVAVSTASCGKSINLSDMLLDGPGSNPPPGCFQGLEKEWTFSQPEGVVRDAVDLLIMMDESFSVFFDRFRLADRISRAIAQLPAGADLRIALIPAVSGASCRSGRLYQYHPQYPAVLDLKTMSPAFVARIIQERMEVLVWDRPTAQGEMGMYSLLRSLEPEYLAEAQAQGFYRPDAALAVLFVTDENDMCYRPDLHGYTKFPDYVPSLFGLEKRGYRRYCLNEDGSERVTPEGVIAALSALKGELPYRVGGIIHVDPSRVPRGGESIGHGILETVNLTSGPAVEISQADFDEELAALTRLSYTKVDLQTQFILAGASDLLSTTLSVSVDGIPVAFTYDSSTAVVSIDRAVAGDAGSVVRVHGCISEPLRP